MKKICLAGVGLGLTSLTQSQMSSVFGIEKDDYYTKKEKRKRKKLLREYGRRQKRLDELKDKGYKRFTLNTTNRNDNNENIKLNGLGCL